MPRGGMWSGGFHPQRVRERGYTAVLVNSEETPSSTSSFGASRFDAAVYVQDTWSAADRVSITGGVRGAREGS